MSLINNEQLGSTQGNPQRNSVSIPTKNSGGIFSTHNNNSRAIGAGTAVIHQVNSRTLDTNSTTFGQNHHTSNSGANYGGATVSNFSIIICRNLRGSLRKNPHQDLLVLIMQTATWDLIQTSLLNQLKPQTNVVLALMNSDCKLQKTRNSRLYNITVRLTPLTKDRGRRHSKLML